MDTEPNGPPALEPGALLPRYEVRELLGRGGMGAVYRAHDTVLHREVALKVLLARSDLRPELHLRFEREAQAMARLAHRNVVAVHDFGFRGPNPYLVMELIRGVSLRQWLDRPGHSFAEVAGVLLDAARGLQAAHDAGLVHRDFKPENVLVGDDGRVAVADFGISRDAGGGTLPEGERSSFSPGNTRLTATDGVIGTPRYMAPEQFAAETTSPLTDQFSFGVVVYEALYGQHPFLLAPPAAALSPLEAGVEVMKGQVRRPPPGSQVPDAVFALVCRMLELAPERRLSSMGEVIAALEGLSASPRPRRWLRVALATLGVAALGLGLSAAGWRVAGPAERPSASSKVDAATAALHEGVTLWRGGSTVPALRRLADATRADPSFGEAWLWTAFIEREPAPRREAFGKATLYRQQLGTADAALLDALAPGQVPMPDLARWLAVLDAASAQRPADGRLRLLRGRVRALHAEREGVLADFAAAGEDPALTVAAVAATAVFERERVSDQPAALASSERCLQLAPRSTDCLWEHSWLVGMAGDCAALTRDARVWIGVDPSEPRAWQVLANALFATGESWASVDEALKARWALPDREPMERRLNEIFALAAKGDLAAARAEAQADVDALAPDASLMAHLETSFRLLLVLKEIGDTQASVALARSVVERARAWTAESTRDLGVTLLFTHSLYNDGAITREQLEAERAKWLATAQEAQARTGTPASRLGPWLTGFAAGARSREVAVAALEKLKDYPPPPPPGMMNAGGDLSIGSVFALGGQPAAALPYLRSVTRSCYRLDNPFAYVRALWFEGEALEATGDVVGARESYRRAVALWGAATPRSIHAERSAERLQALEAAAR